MGINEYTLDFDWSPKGHLIVYPVNPTKRTGDFLLELPAATPAEIYFAMTGDWQIEEMQESADANFYATGEPKQTHLKRDPDSDDVDSQMVAAYLEKHWLPTASLSAAMSGFFSRKPLTFIN